MCFIVRVVHTCYIRTVMRPAVHSTCRVTRANLLAIDTDATACGAYRATCCDVTGAHAV